MGLSAKYFSVGIFFFFFIPEVCASANILSKKPHLQNKIFGLKTVLICGLPALQVSSSNRIHHLKVNNGHFEGFPTSYTLSKEKDHGAVLEDVGTLNLIE